jgi:hypothetical protein
LFQYIVIKLHLSDTVVFDYPHFPRYLLFFRDLVMIIGILV